MDVERIQKINNLAIDLMRQGLAKDREDAVMQAEKVFRSQNDEGYNSLRETMREMKAEKEQENKMSDSIELTNERIEVILERNTQFIVKKMGEFQEKLARLEKEVIDLRTKIAYQQLPTVKEIISKKEEASVEQPSNKEVQTNHPRSGGYVNDDVSIEKFFYMGSK